jgi:hypothetical protein
MPRIPEFEQTLKKMNKIHISKNADYATDMNPFFNFDATNSMTNMFKYNRDKVFAHFIANKFSRLATLLNSGKEANNESLQDTLVDMANYCILFKCDISRRVKE